MQRKRTPMNIVSPNRMYVTALHSIQPQAGHVIYLVSDRGDDALDVESLAR